jgi:uncharacterized protein YutE (UPF0331/DUF86 family)
LAENGILLAEMTTRYAAMAKLRNRLVHLYWEVDDAQVHDYLGASLADIDSFITATAHFISQ